MSDFHGEQRIGDHKVVCDFSGFVCWASETVMTWNKLRVHRRFVGEEQSRHPQEFVRARADNQSVKNPRGEASDVFLAPGDVTAASL
jgi:hypothetical protein